ncbi:HPr family phosphocarrier protein [Saccharobesus litoralis]|uniref:HPr family phosphocarrier protein n=1 Tax=Saccharobesus litoralis TaxID=2172099 RepID=A0A2S0VWU2_9ALTE|nr:HPr family phosphocarrier protein [Saccharobesus litoralis]AWB68655.1 HPr family phosphocarrier protein [Saccharobesus litoralis]
MSICVSESLTIVNKLGLHARAATKLVELTQQFQSTITISCEGKSANAQSVMALLLLAGAQGKQITVQCTGEDAPAALEAVKALIANKFEEAE